MQDPYSTLGVSPSATEKEITMAYRKLAKKYHPDLNPGGATAAKKMGEINAAYDAIKNGTAAKQNSYNGSGGGFGDFGGFGGFGGYGGQQNTSSQHNNYTYFDAVENYLRSGYYQEAYNVLQGISERSAKWYYYSAAVNSQLGNNIVALDHAKKAVEMEPSNMQYRSMLNDLQNGGKGYYSTRQTYGKPAFGVGSCCAIFLLFRFLSTCFCRPF